MTDLLLKNIDRLVADLIAARATEAGRSPEDVAKDALMKGLVWSPAERSAYAAETRGMTPRLLDDSTTIIRELRDAD